jgi:hypothetical protein
VIDKDPTTHNRLLQHALAADTNLIASADRGHLLPFRFFRSVSVLETSDLLTISAG